MKLISRQAGTESTLARGAHNRTGRKMKDSDEVELITGKTDFVQGQNDK